MSTGLGPPALSAKALLPLTQWSTPAPPQLCHSDLRKSLLWLDCLTNEPQGSSYLCLPSTGLTDTWCHARLLHKIISLSPSFSLFPSFSLSLPLFATCVWVPAEARKKMPVPFIWSYRQL